MIEPPFTGWFFRGEKYGAERTDRFDEGRKLEYRKTKTFIAYPPITIVAA